MLTVIWSGVDWFEYSCQGRLGDGVADKLQELKEAARETDAPQPYPDTLTPLYVARQGLKPWAYVLKSDDMHLRFSDKRSVPPASAHLLADGLAAYGHESLYALSRDQLATFGEFVPSVTSRLDIAVDFQGWTPTDADMENIVCRAAYHGVHGHYGESETFQFGKDKLVTRIYNKRRELRESGKWWLLDAWGRHPGYDPELDVWRFEAQMRREGLQSFGVREPEHALDELPSLLASMLQWCSLRIPSGQNRSRWPVDSRWQELAAGAFAGTPLPRVHENRRLADYRRTVAQVSGHLLSASAALDLHDLPEAWRVLGGDVAEYLGRDGASFEALVRRRRAERTG